MWMDTSNFAGPKAKIPREIRGEVTQNSESLINQSTVNDDETNDEAVSIEMNWNIAEQLPDDRNCREEFEAVMTLYLESLVNGTSAADSVQRISFRAYESIQRMHKGFAQGKASPALHFSNALIKVLSTNKSIADEVLKLRCNMLRLIGIGEFNDLATWQDTVVTYILSEVICKACNHCRDIDLCKDKDRAIVNDT